MHVALALYRYFPHGGLQRDFLAVARHCLERGHRVSVLVAEREGALPDGLELIRLPARGWSNHARMRRFGRHLARWRQGHPEAVVVGFNRLPGLDLYFASDSCFAEQLRARPALVRMLPRYRTYLRLERAVLGPDGAPRILFLNRQQAGEYLRHYDLAPKRYRVLPPGVRRDRRPGPDPAEQRRRVRRELQVPEEATLVLFLGSGFRVKGLDRALRALGALPPERMERTWLLVVGDDDPGPYRGLVREYNLDGRTLFAGGRDDVPDLLQAADLVLHPAYRESAGLVLLEAMVAGVPVLTTASCGHAEYVEQAGGGRVVPEPFDQARLDRELADMLTDLPGPWSRAGLRFGENESLYSFHDQVIEEIEQRDGAA